MKLTITDEALARIDSAVEGALAGGDRSALRVLGFGEVSCVVASETEAGRFAVKRLPPFASEEAFARYEATLHDYIERLTAKGVRVAPSELRRVPRDRGRLIAYCIQPMMEADSLGPRHLAGAGSAESFALLLDHVLSAIDATTGLDAQISNWAFVGGEVIYFDVTTPMLRDPEGREKLDVDLFLASLPAPLRPVVKRFMLRSILDKYYDPRGVVVDLLGNLIKEKLEPLIEPFLAIANRRLEERSRELSGNGGATGAAGAARPITIPEIRAYYKDDAGTWALLQRLRVVDRFVQRSLLRRQYPFLLPGKIER